VLDLRALAKELNERGWHCDAPERKADNDVINAIDDRARDLADRKKSLVEWLNHYKVLMGLSSDSRTAIAHQIIAFADERLEKSLHREKNRIVSEFNKLGARISTVVPLTAAGRRRDITSLASKALWCCYPDDVPIYDKNSASALGVISRLCHWAPGPDQSGYACFIDVWFRAYDEVEPAIDQADPSDCPHKVRVLDSLLWYLGQNGFYDVSGGESTRAGALSDL
jgi:hypothetical protein